MPKQLFFEKSGGWGLRIVNSETGEDLDVPYPLSNDSERADLSLADGLAVKTYANEHAARRAGGRFIKMIGYKPADKK